MPVDEHLIGMTVKRRLYDLEPKIIVPSMDTNLGKRDVGFRSIRRGVLWIRMNKKKGVL